MVEYLPFSGCALLIRGVLQVIDIFAIQLRKTSSERDAL